MPVTLDDHGDVCCRFRDLECDGFVQRESVFYCCFTAAIAEVVVESEHGDYNDKQHIKPIAGCPIMEALSEGVR